MSPISIIVSLVIPVIVIFYIVWDLKTMHIVKNPQMTNDPSYKQMNHESGLNTGERLSQEEILENTVYLVKNYTYILLK